MVSGRASSSARKRWKLSVVVLSEQGVHGAGLEQPLGRARRDSGPLRAAAGLDERGAQHAAEGAEVQLVGSYELAGAAAALRVAAAGDAAVRAEVARDVHRGARQCRVCLSLRD
jgi:hypothetical protein